MKRSRLSGIAGSLAGVVLTTLFGCGGMDDVNDGTDQTDSVAPSETAAIWRRPRRPPVVKPTPPPPSPTPGAGGSSGGLTTEQVIAAAQTPDGRAIPQPSGPNGTCPEVVVRLGFWSCPTIGDTCASGGRSCTCSRTDGEGQLPSWICN